MEEKAETGSRFQAEFLSCGSTHAEGRTEQGACTQAFTQTERSLSRACLSQLSLSFPGNQEGGGPAQLPSQLTVILASAVARQRGRRKQERLAGASPPTGRARASSAQPRGNQGSKEAGEV